MDYNYEGPFCQSCGMPLTEDEKLGANADGSKNQEYCVYCFKDGAFTSDMTMEEMIELCLDYSKDEGIYTDREETRKQMMEWFPTLARWKKA